MEQKCANCGNGKWRDGVTAITDTCLNCRYVDKEGCPQPSNWIPKGQTNADRIRAMSDEEIYKFCLSLTDDGWPFACQNKPECDPVPQQAHLCNECFMKWLQQPVEGE